jgi:hypothetical protein
MPVSTQPVIGWSLRWFAHGVNIGVVLREDPSPEDVPCGNQEFGPSVGSVVLNHL